MGTFDLVVIGAGPGGYVAAIRAAQLGLKTAVVEREHLGGVCLNWGCIPSKALLRSAEIFRLAQHGADFGLELAASPGLSVARAVSRSRTVSRQLNMGVAHLLQKNGVSVLWGEARLSRNSPGGPLQVDVTNYEPSHSFPQHSPPSPRLGAGTYDARHIIIATGARPRVLPELPIDEDFVWSYYTALMPESVPTSLIIVGAGAIGVEFACFYRALGIEVVLIEAAASILPTEDAEIVQIARRQLQKQGIKILTGRIVESSSRTADGMAITVKTAEGQLETHVAERVISAVGVVANTTGLGLEECGVEFERGWIKTSGAGRTNVDGLYAIGDAAGPPMLAHKAEHQGVACVEVIAGQSHHEHSDEPAIPACIFSIPNIASIGLTEAAARARGLAVRVGKFPLRANGKALAYGETDGLVKVLFEDGSDRVVGAQMIGSEVPELISTIATAIEAKMTYAQLRRVVFPHPTIAEAVFESVLAAHESAIHV